MILSPATLTVLAIVIVVVALLSKKVFQHFLNQTKHVKIKNKIGRSRNTLYAQDSATKTDSGKRPARSFYALPHHTAPFASASVCKYLLKFSLSFGV